MKVKSANLLYTGSKIGFKFDPFIKQFKGKSPSLCIAKTTKGKIYGAFTNVAWGDNTYYHKNDFKSFVFKLTGGQIVAYRHKGTDSEVYHSDKDVFHMGCYGPIIIRHDTDTSAA